jgi:hypothetical protein
VAGEREAEARRDRAPRLDAVGSASPHDCDDGGGENGAEQRAGEGEEQGDAGGHERRDAEEDAQSDGHPDREERDEPRVGGGGGRCGTSGGRRHAHWTTRRRSRNVSACVEPAGSIDGSSDSAPSRGAVVGPSPAADCPDPTSAVRFESTETVHVVERCRRG